MHIRANVGACLSLKGEFAQEHLRITYMQIIETAMSLKGESYIYKSTIAVRVYRIASFMLAT